MFCFGMGRKDFYAFPRLKNYSYYQVHVGSLLKILERTLAQRCPSWTISPPANIH